MYSLVDTMPNNNNSSSNSNNYSDSQNLNYSVNYSRSLNDFDTVACNSSCTDDNCNKDHNMLHLQEHVIPVQVSGNDVESLYSFFTNEANSYHHHHTDDINFHLQQTHGPFENLEINAAPNSLSQQSLSPLNVPLQQNRSIFLNDIAENVDITSLGSPVPNFPDFGNMMQRHQSVPNFVSSPPVDYQKVAGPSKLYETQTRSYSLSPNAINLNADSTDDKNVAELGVSPVHVNKTAFSSTPSLSSLIAGPSLHNQTYNPPSFNLEKEVKSIVRLAHRNKDISIADIKDPQKSASLRAKILKKIKLESTNPANSSQSCKRIRKGKTKNLTDTSTPLRLSKSIGRPLTATTKVRLTLVPSLPTLYSMLATEPIESLSKPPTAYKDLRGKFHILKKGKLFDFQIEDELKYDSTVDWRFKTVSANDVSSQVSTPNSTVSSLSFSDTNSSTFTGTSGGVFPGKYQTVVFVDSDDQLPKQPSPPQFPSAIGLDEEGLPMYKDIDLAIQEIFGIPEYTLLRVTRAAAFEKTGAIVLKMETIKPGDPWIDDDEFDLRLMYKLFSNEDVATTATSAQNTHASRTPSVLEPNQITTTFLKKKIARPRYKSYMRIYLLPRDTNVVVYTRESMLRRDIVNGTLKLHDNTDPRLIITSFDYTNVLQELNIL